MNDLYLNERAKRSMKIKQYSKELLGNGDLPGTLGLQPKSSPFVHLDKRKKNKANIQFGKQSNDIHVGIIGYQLSQPQNNYLSV